MLTPRGVKIIGLRAKMFSFCGSTAFHWDTTRQRFVHPRFYRFLHMVWGSLFVGTLACELISFQIYLKITWTEIPEETFDSQVESESSIEYKRMTRFAALILLWAEFIVMVMFTLLQYEMIRHRNTVMYLLNQLMDYNEKILNLLQEKEIELDESHRGQIRACEYVLVVSCALTVFIPVGVVIAVMHPIEPIHVMLEEWLDIDLSMRWKHAPLIVLALQALFNIGNTSAVMCFLINIYYFTSVISLNDIAPVEVDQTTNKEQATSHQLVTKYYGTMEDTEIINLYRTQEVFNLLVKEIFGHWTIAFHHVGMLATVSILFCYLIKFNHVLAEVGVIAYFIVIMSLFAPVCLSYVQSRECGDLVDASEEFKDACEQKLEMKSGLGTKIFRRFAKTCKPLYIHVTYPFYNVDRSTFLDFCNQGIDKTITLMFW